MIHCFSNGGGNTLDGQQAGRSPRLGTDYQFLTRIAHLVSPSTPRPIFAVRLPACRRSFAATCIRTPISGAPLLPKPDRTND